MIPISTHTIAHATLIGYKDVQLVVGAILGSHQLTSTLHGATAPIMILKGQKIPTRKADQLNLTYDTLGDG